MSIPDEVEDEYYYRNRPDVVRQSRSDDPDYVSRHVDLPQSEDRVIGGMFGYSAKFSSAGEVIKYEIWEKYGKYIVSFIVICLLVIVIAIIGLAAFATGTLETRVNTIGVFFKTLYQLLKGLINGIMMFITRLLFVWKTGIVLWFGFAGFAIANALPRPHYMLKVAWLAGDVLRTRSFNVVLTENGGMNVELEDRNLLVRMMRGPNYVPLSLASQNLLGKLIVEEGVMINFKTLSRDVSYRSFLLQLNISPGENETESINNALSVKETIEGTPYIDIDAKMVMDKDLYIQALGYKFSEMLRKLNHAEHTVQTLSLKIDESMINNSFKSVSNLAPSPRLQYAQFSGQSILDVVDDGRASEVNDSVADFYTEFNGEGGV